MTSGFYRAFEDKHRGSRALIKSRLQAYLPFVEPLAELYKGAQTIDLGCGRGEWLEVLAEVGFKSHGVDLDEGMLSSCVELGLSVDKGDAIAYLAELPSESQAIVSAFHFVEHISFEQLQDVVLQALRVLKPGGVLIMETPNPENIVVGSCNFYMDPSHQRPIPPLLLSFIPEFHGFTRIKTIRLQESKGLSQSASLTLHDVLGGVSPDYAVIAQKTGSPAIFHAVDTAFEQEYGLTLATLSARYEHQAAARAELAQAQAQQAEAKAELAQAQAQQAEAKAELAQAQAQQAEAKAELAQAQAQQAEAKAELAQAQAQQAEAKAELAQAQAQQAEAKAELAQAQAQQAEAKAELAQAQAHEYQRKLHDIFNSRSWRITAPMRWCGWQIRLLREKGFLARFTALLKKIKRALHSNSADSGLPIQTDQSTSPAELHQLTPRARKIYAELRAEIKKKQGDR